MDTLARPQVPGLDAARAASARPDRRAMVALFGLAAGLFLLFQSGSITVSDGRAMYETTRALVEERSLTVSPDVGVEADGRYVSRYGLGLPVVAIPAYLAAKPAAVIAGGSRGDLITQAAVASVMPLITAALVVALFALSRRLGSSRSAAVLVSLGGIVGIYALPYAKTFFSEPLAALGIVLAIERSLARRFGWASAALVLAIVTRPQSLVLVPVFAIVWLRRGGITSWVRAGPALAAGAAVVVAHNLARFGDPFMFGYADAPGFTTPVTEGIAGLLWSPRKSVLLFAPVLILVPLALARLWRTERDAVGLFGWNAVATFALAAGWWSWAGGWSWGPRLLLPAVIPLLAALGPWVDQARSRRQVVGALLCAGLLVSAPAMIVSQRAQQLDDELAGPSVARQYALVAPVVRYTAAHLDERADGDARSFVDLWQVNVGGVMGAPGIAASLAGSMALAALAIASGRRLRREHG